MATDKEIETARSRLRQLFDGSPWLRDKQNRDGFVPGCMNLTWGDLFALTAAEQVRASEPSTPSHGTDPTWPGPMSGDD